MEDDDKECMERHDISDVWSDWIQMLNNCGWQFYNDIPQQCDIADHKLQQIITIMKDQNVKKTRIRSREKFRRCLQQY